MLILKTVILLSCVIQNVHVVLSRFSLVHVDLAVRGRVVPLPFQGYHERGQVWRSACMASGLWVGINVVLPHLVSITEFLHFML